VDVVDLDRRQPQAVETGHRPDLAHEPRQLVAGLAVAVAAEVDAREDDLTVPLLDAATDFVEHGSRRAAPGSPADERDDAEVAGEAAAVLDLHECPHPIEPRVRLNAPERAYVARHEPPCLLAAPCDDSHVLRQAGECVGGEIRGTAGEVNAAVSPSRPRRRLP